MRDIVKSMNNKRRRGRKNEWTQVGNKEGKDKDKYDFVEEIILYQNQ